MRAGTLRHRASIYTVSNSPAADSYGDPVETLVPFATDVPVSMQPMQGRLQPGPGREVAHHMHLAPGHQHGKQLVVAQPVFDQRARADEAPAQGAKVQPQAPRRGTGRQCAFLPGQPVAPRLLQQRPLQPGGLFEQRGGQLFFAVLGTPPRFR